MKKLVIIIFLLFSVKVLYSQNYYYYFGNKISLEQRTDKVAIILNSNFFKKEIKEKNISEIITLAINNLKEKESTNNLKEKEQIGN